VKAALANWVERLARKRGAGDTGATGVSEVRFVRERSEEQRREPTWRNPPKRIGRRETQGSPVSWSRVQARESRARRKPRRDTGSSRGMGARSRGSGKQKSVVRIVLVPRGKSQDELQGGQSSSKQAVAALTRAGVGALTTTVLDTCV